ncbi:MAG: hypothetical protein ACJATV_000679 [Granulosicoccus sp.]|jgi:hypothetical protein
MIDAEKVTKVAEFSMVYVGLVQAMAVGQDKK